MPKADIEAKDGVQSFVRSAWKGSWWGGSDGGTLFPHLAKGFHFGNYAQGDGQQTKETVKQIIEIGRNGGKPAGFQMACFETLEDDIENCTVGVYHQDRFVGAALGHDAGMK